MDRGHPNHTPIGIDGQRRFRQPEEHGQNIVQQANSRAQQQNPGDREQHPRNDIGGYSKEGENFSPRRVGPFRDPGQSRANQESEQRNAEGINDGIEQQRVKFRIAVGLNVVSESPLAPTHQKVFLKAAVEQHRQGSQGQIGTDQNDSPEDQNVQLKTPLAAPPPVSLHSLSQGLSATLPDLAVKSLDIFEFLAFWSLRDNQLIREFISSYTWSSSIAGGVGFEEGANMVGIVL